jgi:hypothetical protein
MRLNVDCLAIVGKQHSHPTACQDACRTQPRLQRLCGALLMQLQSQSSRGCGGAPGARATGANLVVFPHRVLSQAYLRDAS